jgi:hypothetical protein
MSVQPSSVWHQLATNPWLIAYAAGCLTGWTAARRSIRYLLGGRP